MRRLATGGRRRIPGEPKALSKKRRLTRTQERRRIEGLRLLARVIARHYLAHPELYPSPGGDETAPTGNNGRIAGDGTAAGGEGDHGP